MRLTKQVSQNHVKHLKQRYDIKDLNNNIIINNKWQQNKLVEQQDGKDYYYYYSPEGKKNAFNLLHSNSFLIFVCRNIS